LHLPVFTKYAAFLLEQYDEIAQDSEIWLEVFS